MDSDSVRKNRLIFILLLVAAFIVLSFALRDTNLLPFKVARSVVAAVVWPVQKVFYSVSRPAGETYNNIRNLNSMRGDNEDLSEEVRELKHENSLLRQVEDENIRLRALMGEKERIKLESIPSRVVAEVGSFKSRITIDRGSKDGVEEEMPVVAAGGIVGQVIEARGNSATIRLISDPRNGVAVEVKRTGERGIVEGEIGGGVRLRYLPRASKVKKDDVIITSGLGGVYPRGIVVGKVAQLDRSAAAVETEIDIDPAVRLDRLSEVLVVKVPD